MRVSIPAAAFARLTRGRIAMALGGASLAISACLGILFVDYRFAVLAAGPGIGGLVVLAWLVTVIRDRPRLVDGELALAGREIEWRHGETQAAGAARWASAQPDHVALYFGEGLSCELPLRTKDAQDLLQHLRTCGVGVQMMDGPLKVLGILALGLFGLALVILIQRVVVRVALLGVLGAMAGELSWLWVLALAGVPVGLWLWARSDQQLSHRQ